MVELMRKVNERTISWRPIEPYDVERDIPGDDVYPLLEFEMMCKSNALIDYDGYGKFATSTEVSNIPICPSELVNKTVPIPPWATHVCWFNR